MERDHFVLTPHSPLLPYGRFGSLYSYHHPPGVVLYKTLSLMTIPLATLRSILLFTPRFSMVFTMVLEILIQV